MCLKFMNEVWAANTVYPAHNESEILECNNKLNLPNIL